MRLFGRPVWRQRKMRVVIFIGHHKVGSTALQAHLGRWAPSALQNGVLYPVVRPADLEGFDRIFSNEGLQQDLQRDVFEAHNALAFSMINQVTGAPIPTFHKDLPPVQEMFALIRKQIERYRPHTLVLASEVFANFAAISPALIPDLMAGLGLGSGGARVELFAYLRRVDDYLAAWHGQRVRLRQTVRPLPEALERYKKTIHFDYQLMLEEWRAVLPKARLVVRPYDTNLRRIGTARGFSDAMGLDLPSLDHAPQIRNQGMHRGFLDIARRAVPVLDHDDMSDLLRRLFDLSHTSDTNLPPTQEVELFGAEARRDMAESFAPVHDWLSDIAGQRFFADAAEIGTPRHLPEFEVNQQALALLRNERQSGLSADVLDYLDGFDPHRNFTEQGWAG